MKKLSKKIYGSVINFSDKMLSQIRYKSINNRDFTIICNNCWAGYVYRRFNLPYNTPTVGLYFFASDFVKFCEKLHYYTEQPLNFISYKDSKYKEILIKRKHTEVPVAKIGDIEIVFLHYKDENEAREKWTRRVARINYDNLILKFSQMNYCTEEDLQRFDKIDAKKKICFLTEKS